MVVINPVEVYFKKFTHYHLYFIIIFFATKFMTVWHTLNMIFLSPPMQYTCGGNEMAKENVCPCDNPVWDHSMFTKTVQTKFGIICDKKWLISLSESISFFGLLVGALVFGVLSDRYGRLMIYAVCQLIISLAGCLVTVTPTFLLFCFTRFFEGAGSGGAIVAGYVLCVEFCGTDYRPTVSTFIHIASNLGLICLAGISYLLRDCDQFQLAVSVPVMFCATIKFLLLESPKWLMDKNKKEEAIKVMEKFCRFNKTPYDTVRAEIETYLSSQSDIKTENMKFYHIFKYRSHTKNFFLMAYLYFVCGLCYYGVSQFIGKMSPQVHKNTVINGALLMLGTIVSMFVVNRFGRRPFLRTTMFLAGVFMLIVVCVPVTFNPSWIRTMFAGLSSSCYYMSFIVIFLYGVELFPTNIRSSTLGVLSLVSRFGQVISPQINALSNTAAACTFGISALIGALLTFLLPETRGVALPSSLEDSHHVRFLDRVSAISTADDTQPSKSSSSVKT
ncbi:organic cation transporter protein-like [Cydia strobilella]|uniref:organic cation transporter protein-like n=1 Tax=Cydia strobilella TaxID=1100964 RepID=UPI0030079D44